MSEQEQEPKETGELTLQEIEVIHRTVCARIREEMDDFSTMQRVTTADLHLLLDVVDTAMLVMQNVASEQSKSEKYMFVWDKFCADYTDGLAVAIAKTVEEAEELIRQSRNSEFEEYECPWGAVQKFPVTKPIAFWVNGGE